jgi:hypothetical protein
VKAVELVGLSLVEVIIAAQADEVLVPCSLSPVGGFTLASDHCADPVNVDGIDAGSARMHGVY